MWTQYEFLSATGNREEVLMSYVKVFRELDWLISVRMRASSALILAPSVCATMTWKSVKHLRHTYNIASEQSVSGDLKISEQVDHSPFCLHTLSTKRLVGVPLALLFFTVVVISSCPLIPSLRILGEGTSSRSYRWSRGPWSSVLSGRYDSFSDSPWNFLTSPDSRLPILLHTSTQDFHINSYINSINSAFTQYLDDEEGTSHSKFWNHLLVQFFGNDQHSAPVSLACFWDAHSGTRLLRRRRSGIAIQ